MPSSAAEVERQQRQHLHLADLLAAADELELLRTQTRLSFLQLALSGKRLWRREFFRSWGRADTSSMEDARWLERAGEPHSMRRIRDLPKQNPSRGPLT